MAIANALQSIITNKTNVPADLRSAGIKYKDLFNPLKIPLPYEVSNEKSNDNFALKILGDVK